MKLKKIASLALAGIMAVSMLAGCKDGGNGNGDVVVDPPVDNSFAAAVNEELDDKYTSILSFESDSSVSNALNKIATSTEFNLNAGFNYAWDLNDTSVGSAFRELLDVDDYFEGELFKNSTKDKTVATLLIFNGALTEEGLAKEVASELEQYDSKGYLPLEWNDTANGKRYSYKYSGDMAMTKVTVMNGTQSYYVVAFTIAQDVSEIAA